MAVKSEEFKIQPLLSPAATSPFSGSMRGYNGSSCESFSRKTYPILQSSGLVLELATLEKAYPQIHVYEKGNSKDNWFVASPYGTIDDLYYGKDAGQVWMHQERCFSPQFYIRSDVGTDVRFFQFLFCSFVKREPAFLSCTFS